MKNRQVTQLTTEMSSLRDVAKEVIRRFQMAGMSRKEASKAIGFETISPIGHIAEGRDYERPDVIPLLGLAVHSGLSGFQVLQMAYDETPDGGDTPEEAKKNQKRRQKLLRAMQFISACCTAPEDARHAPEIARNDLQASAGITSPTRTLDRQEIARLIEEHPQKVYELIDRVRRERGDAVFTAGPA